MEVATAVARSGIAGSTIEGPARPRLDSKHGPVGAIAFAVVLAAGIGYGLHGLLDDIRSVNEPIAFGVFALLGLALLIALGFEFVNGFHDTANAVATVIYTHAMPANVAVVWSGFFNFLGVMILVGASPSASSRCCRSS
jgi:PiT family inorganic phosphate transporter